MTDNGGWVGGEVATAQVRVSPVLVEVAQRRVAEARAAGREPTAATVLIANAEVQPVRDTVSVADTATAHRRRATRRFPGAR